MQDTNEVKDLSETENTSEKEKNKEKKVVKDKKYKIVIFVFLIICAVLLIYGIIKKLTKKEVVDYISTQIVDVTHLSYGDIEKEISVTGTIRPIDHFAVTSRCTGEVKEIYVKNGDKVKEGDKICLIDNQKAIDSAKISYEQAKNTFERYESLYKSGNLSRQSYEDYKTSFDRALLEYESQLEYASPVANGDGVIANLSLQLNTMLTNGATICYINGDGLNEIEFGVTERVVDGIEIGEKVKVTKQGNTYEGEVVSKSNQVNPTTGQFDVKARIIEKNNFAAGIIAKVTFVYDRKENVPYINRKIIYYENEKPFVYIVNNNVLEKRFIETGIENNDVVEVTKGLSFDEKIVSTWSNDLNEGAPVRIREESGKIATGSVPKKTVKTKKKKVVKKKKVSTKSEIIIDSVISTMSDIEVNNGTLEE